ncbi:cytochrome P450 [Jannaschia sp. R86511]|uniref:cytochrome P450 n=1 Tax=Jannaschia sp. R86511 TaxID=3093853 RepID=UPI0036D3A1E7
MTAVPARGQEPHPSGPVHTFDPASPTMAADRFDQLAGLRSTSPVVFVPALQMWAVTGYDAVREVLADPARFPSGGTYIPTAHLPPAALDVYPPTGPLWQHSMVSADGAQHRRLRTAMTRAFTASRVRVLEPDVRDDAEALVHRMLAEGGTDLVDGFTRPLPSRTVARFFGLPVEDAPKFSGWSDAFVVPQVPGLPVAAYVAAAHGFKEFDAYVRAALALNEQELQPGIVRDLVIGAREGTHDLTEDELVGDIANVLFAGHETTVSTLTNMFVRLLADRPLWARLATGDVDLPPLVEELLRLDTAGVGLFRACPSLTTLAGVEVPSGARLWVAFGAANRDPDAFPEPDDLRPGRPHTADPLTFGRGTHGCIGTALARTQVHVALQVLPRLAPTMHLTAPATEVPNFIIRSSPHLGVAV